MPPNSPEDVFTPRAATVNPRMYVHRPDLEREMERAVRGDYHIILHGDSGCGKSWLYKRVLEAANVTYFEVNLANASRQGSIAAAFEDQLRRDEEVTLEGYSEKKSGELGVGVAKGALEHSKEYKIAKPEPYERVLAALSKRAKGRRSLIVLDNLERIFERTAAMQELADLVILLDDTNYSRYNAKLLIVGVHGDIREYYARTPSRAPVTNRLIELPEVGPMTPTQVRELVERGFRHELKFKVRDTYLNAVANHVEWVTKGVPQHVQEYCLILAYAAYDRDMQLVPELTDIADRRWLKRWFSPRFADIERAMNKRATGINRRNQILYSIAQIKRDEFTVADVAAEHRRIFEAEQRIDYVDRWDTHRNLATGEVHGVLDASPVRFRRSTSSPSHSGIRRILNDLANRDPKILKRTPAGDRWRLKDGRDHMCLRAMLRKHDNSVIRVSLTGSDGGTIR